MMEHISQSLKELGLCLKPGEVHSLISNNPSEISRLWELLCLAQEKSLLKSNSFFPTSLCTKKEVRNEIFLLTPLFPSLSVFENLFMFEPSLYNQSRLLLKVQFRNLIEEFNLSVSANTLPKNLSTEQNLLISLLRVYVHRPCIVFIPEGLDRFIEYSYANTFEKLMNAIKSNGTTLVFLTSQYEIAMLYSDRVSIVRNGKIISTHITSVIQRYPHDFMNLYMGWELIGNSSGASDIDLISIAPDIRDIALFNTDLKNTLQLVCSDILKITQSNSCQILLTDKKFKIRRTSSSIENHIDYTLSEALTQKLLKHQNMQPFILEPQEADLVCGSNHFDGCFICVPIKAGHGNCLILIEYPQPSQLDDRTRELLINFAKEISVSIEMSVLIARSSLVQEGHHRIKNSLQTIVSLITLEKEKLIENGQENQVHVLEAIVSRIKTIAIVHDLLSHQTENNNLMDLASILNRIADSYRNVATLHFSLNNVIIPYNKALSISLVVNELLTNSVKHSMTEPGTLTIAVECFQKDNLIYLIVTDNGIGFPKDYDEIPHSGIGYSIIKNIVESLSGEIRYTYSNGAKAEIIFPQNSVYMM